MNGATPLFRAIQNGHSALVDYMINQLRVKVQIENRKGTQPTCKITLIDISRVLEYIKRTVQV